jgi:hypothetical protein
MRCFLNNTNYLPVTTSSKVTHILPQLQVEIRLSVTIFYFTYKEQRNVDERYLIPDHMFQVNSGCLLDKYVNTQASCATYDGKLDIYQLPDLHPNFVTAINSLPVKYDYNQYVVPRHFRNSFRLGSYHGKQIWIFLFNV